MKSGPKLLLALFAIAAVTSGCGPTNGLPPLTGEFLYVSNSQDAIVSEFSIDTATGLLSFVAQFLAEPGAETRGLAIHPSNEFIYDDADFPGNVVGMDIGDGSFSGMIFARNSITPAINGPTEIALDPTGKCAYVTNFGGTAAQVSIYLIDQSSGVLNSMGSATAGQTPLGVAVKPNFGTMMLVVNRFDQSVSDFFRPGVFNPQGLRTCRLQDNGTLDLSTVGAVAATPELVAFHPTLPNAYVTDDSLDQIYELRIDTVSFTVSLLGTVAPTPSGAVQPAPFSIVAHPGGKFLYTGSPSNGIVSEFSIDTAGLLTWESNISTGASSPISLAIEPMGRFLYAANIGNSTVAMFSIDPTTGALSPIGEPNTINAESPANPGSGPFSVVTTN